jgi:ABC-2 type transport system permease protein
MNKLLIILKREYLTRVKKKSFILVTLLTPLGIGLIAFVAGYFASKAGQTEKNIIVKDESSILNAENLSSTYMQFTFSNKEIDDLKKSYITDGYDILLYLDEKPDLEKTRFDMFYFSKDKLSLPALESIERRVSRAIRSYKVDQTQIDKTLLESLETSVNLENGIASDSDEETEGSKASKVSTIISTVLSYGMGFLMYMVIFIFGGMVMRSVMEEKINRIVEVIISSVKPFQLMLGKILGVGLVGLTQLGIWIILIMVIIMIMGSYFTPDQISTPESQQAMEMVQEMNQDGDAFSEILKEFSALNWWLILPSFIVFFLGGFLLFSSMFAAIGSTISDDLGEAQQFMLPIIVPVIIAFVMIPAVFNDPDGPIAIFGSMFPLFSPILMPARLPFDPPVWQVLLSMAILIATIIFFIWLAARIYRVGIFMYGKKVSWKELSKWLFYKG